MKKARHSPDLPCALDHPLALVDRDDAAMQAVIGCLNRLQLVSGHLAGLVVADHLVADLLAFGEVAHPGAFDGGDVNEDVSAARVGLNKTKTLCGIEPFNCASGHNEPFPWQILMRCPANAKLVAFLDF
jgi:hypothetical protein